MSKGEMRGDTCRFPLGCRFEPDYDFNSNRLLRGGLTAQAASHGILMSRFAASNIDKNIISITN